jgi:histone H2A
VAAQTILRAINSFFKANPANSTVEQVFFVLYDAESVAIYTSELGKLDIATS